MSGGSLIAPLLVLSLLVPSCRKSGGSEDPSREDSAALDARVAKLQERLAKADSGEGSGDPVARWLLGSELTEVSGLALTPDGRLFAHGDEAARVFEIDYRRGTVVKQFWVGEDALRGDFEGITYAGNRFFLVTSKGQLYEFSEGADGERVKFQLHDTRLGKECEFEGVAFDSTANTLLLPCKNVGEKSLQGNLVIYRYALGTDSTGTSTSELTIPMAQAVGNNRWKQFRPTDIAIDPWTGNYVLVAAQEKAILQVTPAGTVVFSRPLAGSHPQSEGVAVTRDSILIVGDEGTGQPGAITLYRWR
ncbi:MAG TPA: hypothetical protein VJ817_04125 [Gemmatimonadales bacterium]|nr:hypothetical protein [Gemmatimonadales bacterium]